MDVVEILRNLIGFRTINPPGNERGAILWIKDLFERAGLKGEIYALDENRPNLLVRIPGKKKGKPLLVYGHVDVVPVEGQEWEVDPFAGVVKDGYVWGRGALDMKGPLAIYIASLLGAYQKGNLAGDVLFLALSNEEGGGDYGARYMVENHPHLFEGVRYAIGEFGGFSFEVMGRRLYPVMVAEKQICWMRLTFTGRGGHGSLMHRDTAMEKLGRALVRMHGRFTPVHITPVVRKMFQGMADALPFPASLIMRAILIPPLTDRILSLLGENMEAFRALFHNTASPTIVKGGSKVNVIPSRVELEVDGRLLPGFTPQQFIDELRELTGVPFEAEVLRHDPYPEDVDWGLMGAVEEAIRKEDEEGRVIPMLLTGVTDGRFFKRLGIQTYGFAPMRLPPDFPFREYIHAENERIPVEALHFGVRVMEHFLSAGGWID